MRPFYICYFVIAIAVLVVAGCGSANTTSSNTSTATPVAQTTETKVVTAKELIDKIGDAEVADFCRQYNDLGPELGEPLVRGAIAEQYDPETIEEEKNIDAPSVNELTDELISRC